MNEVNDPDHPTDRPQTECNLIMYSCHQTCLDCVCQRLCNYCVCSSCPSVFSLVLFKGGKTLFGIRSWIYCTVSTVLGSMCVFIFLAASLAFHVGLIFYISTLMYVGHPGFMLQTDIKNKKIFNFWIKPFQAKHIPLIWAVNTFIGCLFWLHMDTVSCLLQQQNESLFYLQVQKLFVRSNVFSKVWTTKTDQQLQYR